MDDQPEADDLFRAIDVDTEFPRLKPISSKHLKGINDLVVAAPLKPGFIDAFEHVTYETRARIVLDAFQKMRLVSSDYNLISVLLDSAELIQSIRSFRLAIVEIETETSVDKRLVLAVTFDQPWEPYIRQIWNPLGRMLDVVFCHCQGYVTAVDHSYEEYARWVRDNQVDSGFFYVTSGLTVADFSYLTEIERLHRETPPVCPYHRGDGRSADLIAASLRASDPAEQAARARAANRAKTDDIALEALGGLFRLTSYFPNDRPAREGRFLHRAAHSLLRGWESELVDPRVRAQFREWLAWYEDMSFSDLPAAAPAGQDNVDDANIQAGIINGYDAKAGAPVTHGCLMLMKVRNAQGARDFLGAIRPQLATEAGAAPGDRIFVNLALTYGGLKNLDVPSAELRKFPQEFIEGSEERAGLIGDVMFNHPRRWRLPERNWRDEDDDPAPRPPVALSEIDIVLQLRIACDENPIHDLFADGGINDDHPLADRVRGFADLAKAHGVTTLSVQPMRTTPVAPAQQGSGFLTREHFGFLDGYSQPVVGANAPARDQISRGDVLLGYGSSRGDPPPPNNRYLKDGSFLVIRKLRQDVGALQEWLTIQQQIHPNLDPEMLLARLMGRTRQGAPLVPSPDMNNFDYVGDADGIVCPLQAHIRRANPRLAPPGQNAHEDTRPRPRIMRRGMSYGPRYEDDPKAERGLVFMCYQASIAEQYEAIQRWMNGGNSTRLGSAVNDVLTGAGRPDDARTFRWSDGRRVFRHRIDLSGPLPAGPLRLIAWLMQLLGAPLAAPANAESRPGENPFVALDWLLYLFTPSMRAIGIIAQLEDRPERVELGLGRNLILELGRKLVAKARTAERLSDTVDQLEPIRLAKYGPDDGRPRWWRKLPRSLRYVAALTVIGWRTARKRLFPRPGDHDHLYRVAVAWKSFLEDFGGKDPAERAYGTAVWAAVRRWHKGVMRIPYPDNASDYAAKQPPIDRYTGELELKTKALDRRRPTQKVVLVASRKLVMEVFEDPPERYSLAERLWAFVDRLRTGRQQGRYSVEEGLERMNRSLGPIFVGMDPDDLYKAESARTLAVLREFGEEEAFNVAYAAAKRILDECLAAGDAIRGALRPGHVRPRTAKLDLSHQFITPALADICTYWFGIPDPDQEYVEKGTWRRTRYRRSERPRCPGDFMAASRYIFYPDPNPAVQKYGRELGFRLRIKVRSMFKQLRRTDQVPLGPRSAEGVLQPARIAARMFQEIPDDTDLLARNVVGVMVGMLPPTDGNLRGALHGWLKDKTLWRIQNELANAEIDENAGPAERPYLRAKAALEPPLIEAMQKRPAPDLVFRRALRNLELGDFEVKKGEMLIIGIVSATTEDLGHRVSNAHPVFGGYRYNERHGVHACPGYHIAMGTMLGILAALLDRGAIDALSGALMIRLTDVVAGAGQPPA